MAKRMKFKRYHVGQWFNGWGFVTRADIGKIWEAPPVALRAVTLEPLPGWEW